MDKWDKEREIIQSWHQNDAVWTTAVRQQQIESRVLATNQAIIDAVASKRPATVLDVGCGEGWLARALQPLEINVLGVDVVPGLIEQARAAGGGQFEVMSYEDVAAGRLKGKFDMVVCNFSLIGKESVSSLFRALPALLNPVGFLVVQTIHPVIGCGELPYTDGWREGSWGGFSKDFINPAPWYFRTLESWVALFRDYGFTLMEMKEPLHPVTKKPASVIFTGVHP